MVVLAYLSCNELDFALALMGFACVGQATLVVSNNKLHHNIKMWGKTPPKDIEVHFPMLPYVDTYRHIPHKIHARMHVSTFDDGIIYQVPSSISFF